MAKIKDAIIDKRYYQEKYYVEPEVRLSIANDLILQNLFNKPKQVVKNWYAEYLEKRDKRAEVEDLTDEWRENQIPDYL